MSSAHEISGTQLAEALKRVGYRITRQTARSIRLTITAPWEHHITISAHDSIKMETFVAILECVAVRVRMKPKQLQRSLFG